MIDAFYQTIRFLIKISLRQYFQTIDVRGTPPKESGPLLVVSNHPNYMLDPLLIATTYRRPLWFMAKSVIFNTFTRPLLYLLHAIPIYRRMDNPELMHLNKDSFEDAIKRLEHGGAILIFPEGLSINQRAFEPIKSGAARLALQALEHEKCRELSIQPIGLTYSTFKRLRSAVTLHFGETIAVEHFVDNGYDPHETVLKLTEAIREHLGALTVEVEKDEHTRLIEKITTVYSSLGTHSNYHQRLESVKDNLVALDNDLPELRKKLEPKINHYIALLNSFGLGTGSSLMNSVSLPVLFFLVPIHILAKCIEFIPRLFLQLIISRIKKDFMIGSLQFGLGFLFYLTWYSILSVTTACYFHSFVAGILVFLACYSAVSIHYKYKDQSYLALVELLWPKSSNPLTKLRKLQEELISELEHVRRV